MLKKPVYRNGDGYVSKLSSAIFFIHPMIIMLLSYQFNNYKYFPLILFLSAIVSAGIISLNKRIKVLL